MKTIRIDDETYKRLTVTLGTLMAQTKRMVTYSEAIEALLNRSITLNPDLIAEVENFVIENKHLGYITKEEFIRQAIRFYLKWKAKEYEYIEIPKEKYEKLNKAVKKMRMPYYNAAEFIKDQINKTLEQCEKFLEEKE
jgi:metal-responsive CopG/Arc/MetJ family transcriptional regulator